MPNLSIDCFPAKKLRTPENNLLKYLKNNYFYDIFCLFYTQTKSFTYNYKES